MADKKSAKGIEHIGDIITEIISSHRQQPDGELTRIWQLWGDIVGENIAAYTRPEAFKGTLLLVNVSNSTWIHHLQFLKNDIIQKINQAFGKSVVEEIKFKIGTL